MEETQNKKMYIIFSPLNTGLFGQAPPKPYQNHHLDPISLLMDGSGYGHKTRIHPDPVPKHY